MWSIDTYAMNRYVTGHFCRIYFSVNSQSSVYQDGNLEKKSYFNSPFIINKYRNYSVFFNLLTTPPPKPT